MTFLEQVRQTIARHSMLQPRDRLGVAVSGGADSVCLLFVLLELRVEFGLELSVIHVDHNLRGPQSQADAQFVHSVAQQLSLTFHLRTLDLDLRRGNLEQEARRARHEFFRQLVQDGLIDRVALGHTSSDQAETVLFRFLRGAGSAGLAGIRPVTNGGIIRPLLQVTRPQVEAWLTERNIGWCEDATNQDLRFDRNRIRRQLLPQLEVEWNPALSETLAQTADWAFEEERYWRDELLRLTANWVRFARQAAVVETDRLNNLPVAAARRFIRSVVEQVKGDLLGVNFAHVEGIRRLAAQPEGDGRFQLAGLEVVRSFKWLRFAKSAPPGRDWQVNLAVPCRLDDQLLLSLVGFTVGLELVRNNGVYNEDVNALDWDKAGEKVGVEVGRSLVLRNWRPGDQYQRQGHAGPEKIKQLFQEHHIPSWERHSWPIITVGDSIAWVGKFGPAAQFAVNEDSRTVLSIRVEPETWDGA